MSETETILRIAAKGDGVTASGRHISGAVTGDVVAPDGSITPGPHHVEPPCRHFGKCGGCQLQQADDDALRRGHGNLPWIDRIVRQLGSALAKHTGLTADHPYFEQPKAAQWLNAYRSSAAREKHLHDHNDCRFYDETLP